MTKKVQTTVQLHSFHILARLYLKSFKLGFSCMWTKNFQMYKLGLEKAEEPEIKLPTFITLWRKQGNSRKKTPASLIAWKPLTLWNTTDYGKSLDRNTRPPDLSPEKAACRSRSNRTGHGTTDWFNFGKKFNQAVYCHSAYLIYMQRKSGKMLGWMNQKLESRLPGEMSTTPDIQMIPL